MPVLRPSHRPLSTSSPAPLARRTRKKPSNHPPTPHSRAPSSALLGVLLLPSPLRPRPPVLMAGLRNPKASAAFAQLRPQGKKSKPRFQQPTRLLSTPLPSKTLFHSTGHPMSTKEKLSKQFKELIAMEPTVRGSIPTNPLDDENLVPLSEWRTRVINLLNVVLPKNNPILKSVASLNFQSNLNEKVDELFGALRGVQADFESGLFESLQKRIEAEMSVNFLEQAEQLLKEKDNHHYSYIPAAVLAGAIVEKSLRSLCERNDPPIKTVKPNGQPKAMNALIDDLKKAEVLDEIWSKQLKAWADIRNAAAHGRTEAIKPDQVKSMIGAIPSFLTQFMK